MKYYSTLLATGICFLLSCSKSHQDLPVLMAPEITYNKPAQSMSILIDASRDGGVWWFPQGAGFSATQPHQGKALADYLRNLGYQVDEIGRGTLITFALLDKYMNVVRAGGYGSYAPDEILAYKSFLTGQRSLLFLQDHLQNFPNDQLSIELGLHFEGNHDGLISSFAAHEITNGVLPMSYVAGSVIANPDPLKITTIGTLMLPGTSNMATAMGILKHPDSRIFFIGDMNEIESIPQPFTYNLVKWLFR